MYNLPPAYAGGLVLDITHQMCRYVDVRQAQVLRIGQCEEQVLLQTASKRACDTDETKSGLAG